MGATVTVVAKRGYQGTRVADVHALAGVSRRAFYDHFANKHECVIATLDALIDLADPLVARSRESSNGPLEQKLTAALEAVVRLIVDQPSAARVWFLEVHAVGPEALGRVERTSDEMARWVSEAFAACPERSGIPRQVLRAMLGGLRQIIQARLRHGDENDLFDLIPDLVQWTLSYRTPSAPLHRPRNPPSIPPIDPGPEGQRERILKAVSEIVAERAGPDMTINEIAHHAAVSLSTFYAHFQSKEDALLAAIADGERVLTESMLPFYRQATDWPHAVKSGIHASSAFLAAHPATAKLAGVDIYEGDPSALERHERSRRAFEALLFPGYSHYPGASAIAGEAIGGSISALLHMQLRTAGAARLYEAAPTATFLALAPFMGSDQACALANERWRPDA